MTAKTRELTIKINDITQEALSRCGKIDACRPYNRAYLRLTEEGVVDVDIRLRVGGDGILVAEYHRRTFAYQLPDGVDLDSLTRELEDGELRDALERLYAGHTVEWDGSNMVGRLTDDAQDAEYDVESYIASLPLCEHFTMMNARDYLEGADATFLDEYAPGWRENKHDLAVTVDLIADDAVANGVLLDRTEEAVAALIKRYSASVHQV